MSSSGEAEDVVCSGAHHPITAWAVTTGEAGMRTQARGLAQAVADVVVEKVVALRAPWSWFPAAMAPRALDGLNAASDPLGPPWPDLVVGCGRRSAAVVITIGKASGGRTLIVQIQDPRSSRAAFDLIVATEHDPTPAAANVIKTPTAPHDLTAENLIAAADAWRARFKGLGRPLAGVLIGGPTRRHPFGEAQALRLIAGLRRLRDEGGVGLAITPSRRTPARVRALLDEAFGGDRRVFLWDLAGDNPYRGILALSDRLVVTGESVSMISEALATGHPVEVFDIGSRRHEAFLDRLVAQGSLRRFTGDPSPPLAAHPVDSTQVAAEAVRALLRDRGVFGADQAT
ncbi:MAG TPA: mitochondrial fission ELM1 family protein [Caulobacteraceae bacterium]